MGPILLSFAIAVAAVVYWLRGLRWERGPDQEAPSSWEAQRAFDESRARAREMNEEAAARLGVARDRSIEETARLRVELERVREENKDLRAMLPTDDYRTVARRDRG